MTSDGDVLVVQTGGRLCALHLPTVAEVTRPPSMEPIAGAPAWVVGTSMHRGRAIPIVDLGSIAFGEPAHLAARVVAVRVDSEARDGRRVGLLVDRVLGVYAASRLELRPAPALLHGSDAAAIESIGRLDATLLRVLALGRIVPEATWATLEGGPSSA